MNESLKLLLKTQKRSLNKPMGPMHQWLKHIAEELPALQSSGEAGQKLARILTGESPNGLHLAIFIEPYLSFIFDGKKTVESRFNSSRHPPFQQVSPGDVLMLKRSSGPVCGICIVSHVWFYRLDPKSWREIERFASALCMDESPFWKEKRRVSSFATLMRIEAVARIPNIQIDKIDPRGWVVLRTSENSEQERLL